MSRPDWTMHDIMTFAPWQLDALERVRETAVWREFGVATNRLEFARWLVEHGRINEDPALGPQIEEVSSWS